jgi:hypothetical protein
MNAIYKVHPYIPLLDRFDINDSIDSQTDIPMLEAWGMNLMRLGVMWEAVETAPGVYNGTYFDEIEILINNMGEKGIYTMVDAHQDVVARITCGEGIPDFYAKEVTQGAKCEGDWTQPGFDDINAAIGGCKNMDDYGYAKDENDWPLIAECNKEAFWKYYTSAESLAIFDAIYTNKFNMTDRFVAYWDAVAQRFSQN